MHYQIFKKNKYKNKNLPWMVVLYSQVVPVVVTDSAILRDPYTMKIIFLNFTEKYPLLLFNDV